MPFTAKRQDPKAESVLAQIVECTEAMRDAEKVRAAEASRRRKLITQARKYGVTLDALASAMGVSKGRVRQIEEGR